MKFKNFSWMEIFAFCGNFASVIGLLISSIGQNSTNTNVFTVLVAITFLITILVIAFERDDRMKKQITIEMNQRFENLTPKFVEGLSDKIEEITDELNDLDAGLDELEERIKKLEQN
jgi:hypothetical protein